MFKVAICALLTTLCAHMQGAQFQTHLTPADFFFDARFETIKRHHEDKRIFIETGTAAGAEGVFMAVFAGFEDIYSVELSADSYRSATKRIGNPSNIHLYLGDSATMLRQILPLIQEPALFWLDAHYSGGNSTKGIDHCPLIRELEAIKTHSINTHTILIDDVTLFDSDEFGHIGLDEVVAALKQINPDYQISLEQGFKENDVLVAKIAR